MALANYASGRGSEHSTACPLRITGRNQGGRFRLWRPTDLGAEPRQLGVSEKLPTPGLRGTRRPGHHECGSRVLQRRRHQWQWNAAVSQT